MPVFNYRCYNCFVVYLFVFAAVVIRKLKYGEKGWVWKFNKGDDYREIMYWHIHTDFIALPEFLPICH